VQKNSESYEQEEYIALRGRRESGMVETDTSAVMEWAWKLKSERLCVTYMHETSRTLSERPPLLRTGYHEIFLQVKDWDILSYLERGIVSMPVWD